MKLLITLTLFCFTCLAQDDIALMQNKIKKQSQQTLITNMDTLIKLAITTGKAEHEVGAVGYIMNVINLRPDMKKFEPYYDKMALQLTKSAASKGNKIAIQAMNLLRKKGLVPSEKILNQQVYQKLKIGMTYDEVVKIVGWNGRQDRVLSGGGLTIASYEWTIRTISILRPSITLEFHNGKLAAKQQNNVR